MFDSKGAYIEMKAVRLVAIGQPLEMAELPVPEIGDSDVLVRVKAAGICRSDVHYKAGTSPVRSLPITPGHEIAGVIDQVGANVQSLAPGDRVSLHYLVTCGECEYCAAGAEQFCVSGSMLGKHIDGGYAEFVAVPARNAVKVPDEVPLEHAAIMMCSSSTSFHGLRKGRLQAGERVAVFGLGGLGMSAIQLARAMGALEVYAVDINQKKLDQAASYGAIPVSAQGKDPVDEISRLTGGRGVDLALEVIGLPLTMRQAVRSLGVHGRAVIAGISREPIEVFPYGELMGKEAEIMGTDDHLLGELPILLQFARRGMLDLSNVVQKTIPLDADAINETMDALEQFGDTVRTVIVP